MSHEEKPTQIQTHVAETAHTECIHVKAEKCVQSPVQGGYLHTVKVLEAMVREIEQGHDSIGVVQATNADGQSALTVTPFGQKYYPAFCKFMRQYTDHQRYLYGPEILYLQQAAFRVSEELPYFSWDEPDAVIQGADYWVYVGMVFNAVMERLAEYQKSQDYRDESDLCHRHAADLATQALAVEQRAFADQGRRLVQFVTLNYKPECRHQVSLKQVRKHCERFFQYLGWNRYLYGLKDFVWVIDEGAQSGPRVHMLVFSKVLSHPGPVIAKVMGEHWEHVATQGMGSGLIDSSDNALHEEFHRSIGAGEIRWDDHEKRDALRKQLQCMTDAVLYLRNFIKKAPRLIGTNLTAKKKKLTQVS